MLKTIDFTAVPIHVFLIELDETNPTKDWKVRTLLRNLGFDECVAVVARNSVFVRRDTSKYACPWGALEWNVSRAAELETGDLVD